MIIFIVLFQFLPLFNSKLRNHPTHGNPLKDYTCPVNVKSKPKNQAECNSLFSEVATVCLNKGYHLSVVQRSAHFRGQVICDYLGGSKFEKIVENAKSEIVFDSESEDVKQRLDTDVKQEVEERAVRETKDEISRFTNETARRVEVFKHWLDDEETSYFVKLTNMIREILLKNPVLFSTQAPPTTTYHRLPTNRRLRSDWVLFFSDWTSTPQLNSIGTEYYSPENVDEWRCVVAHWYQSNRLLGGVLDLQNTFELSSGAPFEMEYSFGLVLRDQFRMKVMNQKNDYETMVHRFGGGRSLEGVPLVLTISMKGCHSNFWTWVTYWGVQFHLENNEANKGWLFMSYTRWESHDPTMTDPLAGDDPESQVVLISALGSVAKPKDCTNEILGSGIYRMYKNGTCRGIPLFSRRAAEYERKCTDLMWGGLDLKILMATVVVEKSHLECLENPPFRVLRSSSPAPNSAYHSSQETREAEMTNPENSEMQVYRTPSNIIRLD